MPVERYIVVVEPLLYIMVTMLLWALVSLRFDRRRSAAQIEAAVVQAQTETAEMI
jgi:hypothetical protein